MGAPLVYGCVYNTRYNTFEPHFLWWIIHGVMGLVHCPCVMPSTSIGLATHRVCLCNEPLHGLLGPFLEVGVVGCLAWSCPMLCCRHWLLCLISSIKLSTYGKVNLVTFWVFEDERYFRVYHYSPHSVKSRQKKLTISLEIVIFYFKTLTHELCQ